MIRASLHHTSISSRDIALLLAVAEGGSIRRAAETLGVAQPSLSKSIRLIEERLGVSLFERSTSGSQATLLGGDLMARGRQVLLDLAAIQRDLTDALRGDSGEVRVGLGTLVAPLVGAPMIKAVRAGAPNIRLDIQQLHPRDILRQIESGMLDFGFCHVEDLVIGAALRSRLVSRLPALFIARRGHPLDGADVVKPAQLADFPLTLPHSYARLEAWFCAFTGAPECRVAAQGHDFELVGALIEQSDDISITTPGNFERLRRRFDVERLNVPGIDFHHEVHSVTPAVRPLGAAAQRVHAIVEKLLGQVAGAPAAPVCGAPIARLRNGAGYHPIDSRQLVPDRAAA